MRFLESMRGGFLAAVLAVLAACTVVVEDPAPIDPGPGPRICTREYQPVCARRDGERRTFPNECLAETSGYRVIRNGECRRVDDESPRVCTRFYDQSARSDAANGAPSAIPARPKWRATG